MISSVSKLKCLSLLISMNFSFSSLQKIFHLFILPLILISCNEYHDKLIYQEKKIEPAKLDKIVFGSCSDFREPMDIWKSIGKESSDLFIWTGDIVYADKPYTGKVLHDMERLEGMFSVMQQNEYYRLMSDHTPVIGIFDDHDFCSRNGGKEYIHKNESKKILLDFLGEPKENERREREGIYTSYVFNTGTHTLKVILLDTRSFYVWEGKDKTSIGEKQFEWVENELKNDTSMVTIFASGYQFLPVDNGEEGWYENSSRQRMIDLLKKYNIKNPIWLTGDRHFAEISQYKDSTTQYTIHEIMSSGLTHYAHQTNPDEKNRFRIGKKFIGLNYGVIQFNWNENPVTFELQIKDVNGNIVLSQKNTCQ